MSRISFKHRQWNHQCESVCVWRHTLSPWSRCPRWRWSSRPERLHLWSGPADRSFLHLSLPPASPETHTHTQREASSNWINVLHSPLVFTLVGTFEESIRIKWQTNCGSVNVMDSRSSEGHETGSLKNTLERSRNLNESGEVKKVKHFFVVFLGQGPQTSSSGATSRLK